MLRATRRGLLGVLLLVAAFCLHSTPALAYTITDSGCGAGNCTLSWTCIWYDGVNNNTSCNALDPNLSGSSIGGPSWNSVTINGDDYPLLCDDFGGVLSNCQPPNTTPPTPWNCGSGPFNCAALKFTVVRGGDPCDVSGAAYQGSIWDESNPMAPFSELYASAVSLGQIGQHTAYGGDSVNFSLPGTLTWLAGSSIPMSGSDSSNENINYSWNGAGIGSTANNGSMNYTAPMTPGTYTLTMTTNGATAGSCVTTGGGSEYVTVTHSESITIIAAPTTSIAMVPGVPNGTGGWWISGSVKLTCTPQSNNCAHTYYQLSTNGGGTFGGTQTHTWPNIGGAQNFSFSVGPPDGKLVLRYWSDDTAPHTESTNTSGSYFVDSTAPTTTGTGTGTTGNVPWLVASPKLSETCTDPNAPYSAGCSATYYSDPAIAGGATQTYAAPAALADGVHTVTVWSKDAAGNVEAGHPVTIHVDTTPPVTPSSPTVIPAGAGTADVSWPATTDATSGVATYQVQVYDTVTLAYVYSGWVACCAASISGLSNSDPLDFSVRAQDVAGNISPFGPDPQIILDIVPPTTNLVTAPVAPDGTGGWFKTTPTLTLSCVDNANGSGCQTTYWAISSDGGSTWGPTQSYTPPSPCMYECTYSVPGFTVPDGSTMAVKYWSVDVANNVEGAHVWTAKIDSQTPVPVITPSGPPDGGNGWYVHPPTWTGGCTFGPSGNASDNYTVNAGAPVPYTLGNSVSVVDGTWVYDLSCTSQAGNTGTVAKTFKVDDGAYFTTGSLVSPANGTLYCLPAICSEIAGGTPMPAPLSFTWTAASDTCPGGCAGISGYWLVISKLPDLSSPVFSASVGNATSYSAWTPAVDDSYYWDVQAYTNAAPVPGTIETHSDLWESPVNGNGTPGPWSFAWVDHDYEPPTFGDVCGTGSLSACAGATGTAWWPYPAGNSPFHGFLDWIVGKPLDIVLSATFSGANQYGTCPDCPAGWSATSANVKAYRYYPPSSSPGSLPAAMPVAAPPVTAGISTAQGWTAPGSPALPLPSSCPVGANPTPSYLICYTVDVQVTYQDSASPPDSVTLTFVDVPHTSGGGTFLELPVEVDAVGGGS